MFFVVVLPFFHALHRSSVSDDFIVSHIQKCMGVEYCAKRPVCRSFEWINKLFPNVFIVNSCREPMIVATLTLLNFSPSWCGRSDRKLWKPALMLCIRRRSLLFAISRLIRFSFSMAVVWPPPPSSSSLCKLHIQKKEQKKENKKKWIEWMNERTLLWFIVSNVVRHTSS